jgi:multiple sugar transport system permease protein
MNAPRGRRVGSAAPPIGAEPAAVASRRWRADNDRTWRWAIFSPALLLMLALSVLPLANLLLTSFYDVTWTNGQAVWTPRGLANYAALPGDALFRAGLVNTVVFAAAAVGGQMVLGFVLAVLCSRVRRGQVLYRTVFILPILIPGIVVGAIWKLMFNYDFGLINQAIGLLGFAAQDWLGTPQTALASVVVVDIWHWTPFCFLLFLAGLESLPQDVYEAARIDGASIWQELRYVTLPLMLPTIVVTFAFRLMVAFKVFDEVYLLTGGGPGTATEVLSFTIYQRFFTENRVGNGAAMSVAVIFLVSVLLVFGLSARKRAVAA